MKSIDILKRGDLMIGNRAAYLALDSFQTDLLTHEKVVSAYQLMRHSKKFVIFKLSAYKKDYYAIKCIEIST